MQSKHTPGPWVLDKNPNFDPEFAIVGDNGIEVCSIVEVPKNFGYTDANARLIAAAPDLLAACEMAANEWPENFTPCLKTLRAAIAKAKGESQ